MQLFLSSALILHVGFARAFPRVAALGYDGVELWATDPASTGEALSTVAAAARANRLDLTVHSPPVGHSLADADPDARAAAVAAASRSLVAAAELGSRLVVVHPGNVKDRPDQPNLAWSLTCDALTGLLPLAEENGVMLAFENMERRVGEVVNGPGDCLRLLEEFRTPWLGLTIDFAHAFTHGLVDAFLDFADRANHVHMSDSAPGRTHVARWGDGALDLPRIVAGLAARGYAGAIVIEGTADQGHWEIASSNAERWRALLAAARPA